MKKYLEAGKLGAPRGIRGELRFDCWCDSPEFLRGIKRFYLDSDGDKYLDVATYNPSIPTIIFKGYENRESAGFFRGRILYFDRDDVKLEPGVYFNDDLINTPVYDEQGNELGFLTYIEDTPNGFNYVVKGEKMEYYFPYNDFFVKSLSPEKIVIHLVEGLGKEIKSSSGNLDT